MLAVRDTTAPPTRVDRAEGTVVNYDYGLHPKHSTVFASVLSCAPNTGPRIAASAALPGSRAERETEIGTEQSSLLSVVPIQRDREAAPYGLDRRGGHRERIAEGISSHTSAPLPLGNAFVQGVRGRSVSVSPPRWVPAGAGFNTEAEG